MFVIDFLIDLPLLPAALLLMAFFAGFAMAGLWIVRRWVLPKLRLTYQDAYYGAVMVQSAMLLYGLVAALTAVSVWQRYSQVADIVSGEATALVALWRDVGGYPAPARDEARDTLRGYTLQIINEAWPQQARGEVPRGGVVWMDKLETQFFAFEPATDGQRIAHGEVLRGYNHLLQQRRQRVDAVQGGLPGVLWLVLIPGALFCIVLSMFFHLDSARFQAILLLGVSISLSMVIFIIVALDRPFVGQAGIPADSYRLVFEHQMKPTATGR